MNKKNKIISIKSLFIYGALFFLLLTIVIGTNIIINFRQIQKNTADYIDESKRVSTLNWELYSAIGYGGLIHNFKNYLIRGDIKYYNNALHQYERFSDAMDKIEKLSFISQAEKKDINTIRRGMNLYSKNLSAIKKFKEKGLSIEDLDKIVKVKDDEVISSLLNLTISFNTLSDNQSRLINETFQKEKKFLSFMISLYLILSLFFIFGIYKLLSNKLHKISQIAKSISTGDLRQRVDDRSNDLLSQFAHNFNDAITKISEILQAVKTEAERTGLQTQKISQTATKSSTLSEEIKDNSEKTSTQMQNLLQKINSSSVIIEETKALIENFSNRALDQVGAVDQTSSSIEQMSSSISSVTQITKVKLAQSKELILTTSKGNEKVLENQRVTEDINSSVNDIHQLIEVINGVASQTNLLSMNAAIEAAHAGEAGKGFAVVADEIRKLAESTAYNATQISETLTSLTEKAEKALISSRLSSEAFIQIEKEVNETSQSFEEIGTTMEELNQGSQEILKASNSLKQISSEIETGSKEMNSGINELDSSLYRVKELSIETDKKMKEIKEEANNIDSISKKAISMGEESHINAETLLSSLEKFILK